MLDYVNTLSDPGRDLVAVEMFSGKQTLVTSFRFSTGNGSESETDIILLVSPKKKLQVPQLKPIGKESLGGLVFFQGAKPKGNSASCRNISLVACPPLRYKEQQPCMITEFSCASIGTGQIRVNWWYP